jgi:uncharacterized protein YlxW (UPF0749 family)
LDARGEGITVTVDDPGKLPSESFGFDIREFKDLHGR